MAELSQALARSRVTETALVGALRPDAVLLPLVRDRIFLELLECFLDLRLASQPGTEFLPRPREILQHTREPQLVLLVLTSTAPGRVPLALCRERSLEGKVGPCDLGVRAILQNPLQRHASAEAVAIRPHLLPGFRVRIPRPRFQRSAPVLRSFGGGRLCYLPLHRCAASESAARRGRPTVAVASRPRLSTSTLSAAAARRPARRTAPAAAGGARSPCSPASSPPRCTPCHAGTSATSRRRSRRPSA